MGVEGATVNKPSFHFTGASTAFGANNLGGHETGVPVQPSAQDNIRRKLPPFLCKSGEYILTNVLRELVIPADKTIGGREHQIQIARNQFGKGSLGAAGPVVS